MSVSAEFLDRCAAETGFPPATLEKVMRLGELAGDIGRHPLLGGVLALKGGTALNLRLEEPPRLSVDLDFNYIDSVDRQRMIEERPKVEAAVEELARRRSYRIQRSRDEHGSWCGPCSRSWTFSAFSYRSFASDRGAAPLARAAAWLEAQCPPASSR